MTEGVVECKRCFHVIATQADAVNGTAMYISDMVFYGMDKPEPGSTMQCPKCRSTDVSVYVRAL